MNKSYRHLFFDLDHTLWDFEKNTAEALHDLYDLFQFSKKNGFSCTDLIRVYHEVNNVLWKKFGSGRLDMYELRKIRFPTVLTKLGMKQKDIPANIGMKYLEIAPRKSHVMPYTKDVLKYLNEKYKLHLITNGFNDVQLIKIKHAGINNYFKEIITSDTAGCHKPDKGIFDYALRVSGSKRKEAVMIGDNIEADIQGARNASIDQIYFNPKKLKHDFPVTHEIFSLKELMKIL